MPELILTALIIAIGGASLLLGDYFKKLGEGRKSFFPPIVHALAIIVLSLTIAVGVFFIPLNMNSLRDLSKIVGIVLLLIYGGALIAIVRFNG